MTLQLFPDFIFLIIVVDLETSLCYWCQSKILSDSRKKSVKNCVLSEPQKYVPIHQKYILLTFTFFKLKLQYDRYWILGKRMYVICWYWHDIKNEKNLGGKMHFLTFLSHHFVIFRVLILLLSEKLCVEEFWVNMVIELMCIYLISSWELWLPYCCEF